MPSTAPPIGMPSQSLQPVARPAARGGAGGDTAQPGDVGGKINLDGTVANTTGNGSGNGPAPAPDAGASGPLRLDLRGGSTGVGRSRSGLVPLLSGPPDDASKSKLAKDLQKAGRADCKDAHADDGLLGVLPLAKDTMTDKGCKW
jgi:hypothetical protein